MPAASTITFIIKLDKMMQLVEIGYIKKMQNNKDDCMRSEAAA